MTLLRRLIPVAACLVSLWAPALLAQSDDAAARAAYAKGQTEYNLGNYDGALKMFEEAYRLKPVPPLLFNIAQCHRNNGDLQKAANTYRSFIRNANPTDKNLGLAKELLAQVEDALKKQSAAQSAKPQGLAGLGAADPKAAAKADAPPDTKAKPAAEAKPETKVADAKPAEQKPAVDPKPAEARPDAVAQPAANKPPAQSQQVAAADRAPDRAKTQAPPAAVAAPAPPEKSGGGTQRVIAWSAGGAAAVALAGGALFGLKSKSGKSDLQASEHSQAEVTTMTDQVKSDAKMANLLFVAGGVLAVVSAGLFVIDF
ncbi:MAG: tetratricopeptide repeat protein [Deltaproteobacteria bacterium]|nr:tetratricopeptide repeat protein [Deltaproteobacteria bacterium]